ncbi:MAG: DUF995 domain-containing protein [Pseudaminobacter sp.]
MVNSRSERARIVSAPRILPAVAWALSCVAAPAIAASVPDPVLPENARNLTAGEIYELYRDRSWQWEHGAGRMKASGRQFSAWVDGEAGKSWADGRWIITDTGRLCLDATWHTGQGAFPAKTCFSHRAGEGRIYQKREPDGAWYVFLNSVHRQDNKAGDLVSEDLVSRQRDDIKAALGALQSPQQ